LTPGHARVTTLNDSLKSADLAVRIRPAMLGQNGPKRYFLVFQKEAEARGTGGLAGAFAIVQASWHENHLRPRQPESSLPRRRQQAGLVPRPVTDLDAHRLRTPELWT
jgi:hypothetical protein